MLRNSDVLLDKVDDLQAWTDATPGACNGGRAIATDDPDRLGWEVIQSHLRRDGLFVFRHVPVQQVAEIGARVEAWGYGLHSWRVFHGTAEDIRSNRRPPKARSSHQIGTEARPSADMVTEAMSFLREYGIKPFTARILSGQVSPSVLVSARAADGTLHGVAFGHVCFNAHSPWAETAWCGLVAVAAAARGCGLGRTINDAVIDAMFARPGISGVVEYAAEDNLPSRRMIEGSGLTLRHDFVTCAASRSGTRPTR